jgi:transcriptional regulator GlxA family with amidase domain
MISSHRLRNFVAPRAGSVRRLCFVCTGASLLAAADQLDGKRVATHWAWLDRLKMRHPALDVDPDSIFMRDGNLWTSAEVSLGVDLALVLIEQLWAAHRDQCRAADGRVHESVGAQSQFSVPLATQMRDHAFADPHGWMAANLTADPSVSRLVERAGMALRTYARAYATKVGRTPARTVERMRP